MVSQAGRDRGRHAAPGQGHRILGHGPARRRRGARRRIRRRQLRDDLPRAPQLPSRAHAACGHIAHRAIHPRRPVQRQLRQPPRACRACSRAMSASPACSTRRPGPHGRRPGRRALRRQHEPGLGRAGSMARAGASRATCPCRDPIIALDRGAELGWFNMGSTVVVLFASQRTGARRRASSRHASCGSASGSRCRDERTGLAAGGDDRGPARDARRCSRGSARTSPRSNVLEVQTPVLSAAAVSDPQIESIAAVPARGERLFLQTSPEYPDEAAARGRVRRLLPGLPGFQRRANPAACTIPNSR